METGRPAPAGGRDLLAPTGVWAAMALLVAHVQQLAAPGGPRVAAAWWRFPGRLPSWFAVGRVAYDSGLYLQIARHGYGRGLDREAAFPAYALAIRWLSGPTGWPGETSAVAIATVAGLAASLATWRWLRCVGLDGAERWVAQLLVLLFPFSFLLYGTAYTDGLLLATTMAAALAAERRRWAAAGILGALATATRPTAIPIVVLLALLVWRDRPLRPRHLWVVASLAGVVGYSAWLWGHTGDPLYWGWVQQHRYGHSPLWHPWTWLKFPVWRPLATTADRVHEAASLALLVGAIATVRPIWRRLGAPYAAYVALLIAMSWSGIYDFAPAGRYLLPAVPVLAVAWAPWLAHRRPLAVAVLVTSGATCLLLAAGFSGAFALNW